MISVIVPVYNVAAYLNRCVDSIIHQTYKDLEIILVDDGSPDNCGVICDEWSEKDDRIKVIHKANGGLSDARNAGLEIATGDYIGFVDSDDWIKEDMYQDLLEAIKRENTQLAVTGIDRTYDNGFSRAQFVSEKPYTIDGDRIVQAYLGQGAFSTAAWDKLYARSLFNTRRFPVGKQYEDAPVIFDILCAIDKIAVIGKPQYVYFQRADSITGLKFSERKMDHYEFSKQIRERVYSEYYHYREDADVFWGCKLVEILYSLYESVNRKEFVNQERQMRTDLKEVQKKVIRSSSVPTIMKVKTLLLIFGLAPAYITVKEARAKRK